MPLLFLQVKELREMKSFHASGVQVKVWEGYVEELRTIFLEPTNGYFWAGCIYGRKDDAQRFGFFCHAALEYLKHHAGGSRCALTRISVCLL
jgi:starch synthase